MNPAAGRIAASGYPSDSVSCGAGATMGHMAF